MEATREMSWTTSRVMSTRVERWRWHALNVVVMCGVARHLAVTYGVKMDVIKLAWGDLLRFGRELWRDLSGDLLVEFWREFVVITHVILGRHPRSRDKPRRCGKTMASC